MKPSSPGVALVDGQEVPLSEVCVPYHDPAVTVGWSVFETLVVAPGEKGALKAHLDRLQASCRAALLPPPAAEVVAGEVTHAVNALGQRARVRITLTGGGMRLVVARPADPMREGQPVRAARGPHRDEPFLAGTAKHGSRAPWVVAVKRRGVDEILLVDEHGRFTEGTTSAVLAVIEGELWTAPHDGRILASTTCAALLDRAHHLDIPVRRQGPPADGPWDGLYIASVTRHLAPVVELDGEPLPGWEPVGRRLAERAV